MLKSEDKEKIEKYIEGRAKESEYALIEDLFLNGETNETLRNSLKKDWFGMVNDKSGNGTDLSHVLDRVHHMIRNEENTRRKKPLLIILQMYRKAAAILLIPLLVAVSGYYFLETKAEKDQISQSSIYAPLGARVSFKLPDGTTGMLNSGSSLVYSMPFNNDRRVGLEGEAWFNVFHDEKHPFEITSGTSTVTAFGTRFNISAYPYDGYVEVVLEEGKVNYKNKESFKDVPIYPSERLIFKNGKITKIVTDPAKYNSWTEGKLVFRGDPMAEVARRLERWYNVKINIADKKLEKYSFRGIFLDDSLEDVLRFLCMTSPITYSVSQRELLQDGTYKKEEVTINLK